MKMPKISVVMPAKNAQKHISKAIESILHQTFEDFEFIIVDDVSSDDTLGIVRRYAKKDPRIRVVKNKKRLFIAGSLNKAIGLAKGDTIARMDADDESSLERLELQYKKLTENHKVAVVGAYMRLIDEDGKEVSIRKYPTTSKGLKSVLFRYSPFAHPVVMFRKKVFNEFGGYKEDIFPCEDLDLWFKIGSKYEFATVPRSLLKYRLYSESSSHKDLKSIELLGLKIKVNAIKNYGYRPTAFDVIYNLLEYTTLWIMPPSLRIKFFNFLRKNELI